MKQQTEKQKICIEFITQYEPFIRSQASNLQKSSNGKITFDDAIQALHEFIWEACCSEKFSEQSNWKSYLFCRVKWGVMNMINSLSALKVQQESLFDVQLAEACGGAEVYILPTTGDTEERRIQAQDWIKKALELLEEKGSQDIARLILDTDSGFFDYAVGRGKSVAAKYEFFNYDDLVSFTGDRKAVSKMNKVFAFLKSRLGNPVGE